MNQQLNYEQTNQAPIRVVDEITDEGAMRLAAEIVKRAREDYHKALKTIMQYRRKDRLTGKEFLKLQYAHKQKKSCEAFYKSDWFITLTLGMALPGTEVIEKLKKMVGYKEIY